MDILTCGIDPGKKGGFGVIDTQGQIVFKCELPQTPPDMAKIFTEWAKNHGYCRVFVEKCQAMPGQSVTSMFKYGLHYGEILGVLGTLGIPHEAVRPQKWQSKLIGSFKKGQSKVEAYKKAKQLWPSEEFILPRCRVAHDGIVDAVLIAEYGRLLNASS